MTAHLTRREYEVAELLSWGASKKEIVDILNVEMNTVMKHSANIYRKLRIQKVSELSAWYFCSRFNISMDLSPIKRKVYSTILLAIIVASLTAAYQPTTAMRTARTASTTRTLSRRMREDIDITDLIFA